MSASSLEQHLQLKLEHQKQQSRDRHHKLLQSAQTITPVINGKKVLSFNSNDYLGLANHPKLSEALCLASKQSGVGSGSAHLVSGHHHYHQQLEQDLAAKTGYPRALLFSTGYMANLAIASLVTRHDSIIQDKLNHASLIDAAQLSGAQFKRYRHNDLKHCETQLQNAQGDKLLMTDAVFSMDGNEADLSVLSQICSDNNADLMIDDAHGFGVLGDSGAGSAEQAQLSPSQLPIYMATLGKAIGSFGAFVAASDTIIEALINFARPYIFTTAMPPAIAAATSASIKLLNEESWRREKLQQNIQYFRERATAKNLPLMQSKTAIQPILLGDNKKAVDASQQLLNNGILVSAIRPPTVPPGSARLRITLCAEHSLQQIDQLIDAI
ncbi:MAG: 8-amino-7-oxononanoate synthase [Gammaproteobacteria bacterium]|nr:8-amino-7-oxononanoate synthase [Gammaproteobacteria bacterium]